MNPGVPGCGILLANLPDDRVARVKALGEALVRIYVDAVMPDGTPGDVRFRMTRVG